MAIPTLAMIPSGYKAGKLYSVLPSDGTGDFTVARNSVATRVNQSGLIEEVGVNVPRLDYSAGGCPVLLTEIESQNLITYSEDFSDSTWTKTAAGTGLSPVVTNNYSISPDGNLNASRVVFDINSGTSSSDLTQIQSPSFVMAANYSNSVWLKSNTGTNYNFSFLKANGNVTAITVTSSWQRFENSVLSNVTTTPFRLRLRGSESTSSYADISIYGAQLEQQPAATSYIKSNTGSPTTREADLVNGAGSTATFNSLEHTIFIDLNSMFKSGLSSAISIVGSTGTVTDNRILIQKQTIDTQFIFQVRSGGATVATETFSNIDFSIKQKLAITVKENEVKYYRNGFLVATDTGTIPLPVSLGELTLTSGTTGSKLAASTKDIRYYNQVLTEAETLELMSYDSFNEMASALQYTIK